MFRVECAADVVKRRRFQKKASKKRFAMLQQSGGGWGGGQLPPPFANTMLTRCFSISFLGLKRALKHAWYGLKEAGGGLVGGRSQKRGGFNQSHTGSYAGAGALKP